MICKCLVCFILYTVRAPDGITVRLMPGRRSKYIICYCYAVWKSLKKILQTFKVLWLYSWRWQKPIALFMRVTVGIEYCRKHILKLFTYIENVFIFVFRNNTLVGFMRCSRDSNAWSCVKRLDRVGIPQHKRF